MERTKSNKTTKISPSATLRVKGSNSPFIPQFFMMAYCMHCCHCSCMC